MTVTNRIVKDGLSKGRGLKAISQPLALHQPTDRVNPILYGLT